MKQPLVSIILPTYNEEENIRETIESILNQTYEDFELLIIDQSTDRTPEIVQSFNDKRIKLLRNEEKSIPKALNRGIKESEGRYIARMDADCIAHPKRIEKQVKFLSNNQEIGVVGTWALFEFKENKRIIRKPIKDIGIKKRLNYNVGFIHPTIMVRKDIYGKTNGYREKLERSQDYGFYLDASEITKFSNIPEILLYRRDEKVSTSWKTLKDKFCLRLEGFKKQPKDMKSGLLSIIFALKILTGGIIDLILKDLY